MIEWQAIENAFELFKAARRHLPATHVPTRLWIVDHIPRTPSLKIDRATARDEVDRRIAADRGP